MKKRKTEKSCHTSKTSASSRKSRTQADLGFKESESSSRSKDSYKLK